MNHLEKEPFEDINVNGARIRLVGTAHLSQASTDFVIEQIEKGSYDCVAVELCASRCQQLMEPEAVENMDLFEIIKKKKVLALAVMLAMSAFQQRIAQKFRIEPGSELKAAIQSAAEKNIPFELIDRDVGVTFGRFFGTVSWWERLQIFGEICAGIVSRDDPSKEEIESLKSGDLLEQVISGLSKTAPQIHNVLISERDRYMALKLSMLAYQRKEIVAVVGAGHLSGMIEAFKEPVEDPDRLIRELEKKPESKKWPRLIPFFVLALIFGGFFLGFQRSPALGMAILGEWVLINGGLSALGVIIASGHPLTVLTAFFAAPITSLNPTIGAGMVTGLVEAWIRKPTVADFAQLKQDSVTFSGWRGNRVSRTFLVFILSSFGSAVGTYVAGFRIFGKLFS